jgi:hypothetical protein
MKQRFGWLSIVLSLCIFFSANLAHADDTDARRAKAREMIELVKKEGLFRYTIEMMLTNAPEAQRDRLRELVTIHLDEEEAFAEFLDIASDTYTVEEMEALLEFYSTPIGRSILVKRQTANARFAEALVRIMQQSVAEAAKE